jgi:hypothetical protein
MEENLYSLTARDSLRDQLAVALPTVEPIDVFHDDMPDGEVWRP